eukprot:13573333-Alexandrium_andersonii.AAC.1
MVERAATRRHSEQHQGQEGIAELGRSLEGMPRRDRRHARDQGASAEAWRESTRTHEAAARAGDVLLALRREGQDVEGS